MISFSKIKLFTGINFVLCRLQFDCHHELQLPMVDPDGDNVKCRWAVGDECHSICKAVPVATLDEVI